VKIPFFTGARQDWALPHIPAADGHVSFAADVAADLPWTR